MKVSKLPLLLLLVLTTFIGAIRPTQASTERYTYTSNSTHQALSPTAAQQTPDGEVLGAKDDIVQWLAENIVAPSLWTWTKQLGFALVDFGNMVLWGDCDDPDVNLCKDGNDDGGLIAYTGSTLNLMYAAPPKIGFRSYMATLLPIKEPGPVHAQPNQGTSWLPAAGEGGYLSQTATIWQLFRNVAYALTIVVLVVVGFAIMVGIKTDPYTTVTLQQALPKIILMLLLITFSFAISGLIMDIGEVLIRLITNLLQQLNVPSEGGTPFQPEGIDFSAIGRGLKGHPPLEFAAGVPGYIQSIAKLMLGVIMYFAKLTLIITLIIKFAAVYFLTILSPFAFLLLAVPGAQNVALKWFESMLAAVLAFPGTYLVLNIGYYFNAMATTDTSFELQGPSIFGGGNITGLIIVATLFIASKVPAAIEDALDATVSGYVAKAGADPISLARKVPIIGSFL